MSYAVMILEQMSVVKVCDSSFSRMMNKPCSECGQLEAVQDCTWILTNTERSCVVHEIKKEGFPPQLGSFSAERFHCEHDLENWFQRHHS
jgi:hypothetical protein